MKTFWAILLSVILSGVIVGSGMYYYLNLKASKEKKDLQSQIDDLNAQLKKISSESPIDPTDWTAYTNAEYKYSFKHPSNLEIASGSTNSDVIVGTDEQPWVYNVKVSANPSSLTLQQTTDLVAANLLKSSETAKPSDEAVTDITVGGVAAKRFSIKNFGDYGNAGAVVIVGDNIITIFGDDSTLEGVGGLDAFISTFEFETVHILE